MNRKNNENSKMVKTMIEIIVGLLETANSKQVLTQTPSPLTAGLSTKSNKTLKKLK